MLFSADTWPGIADGSVTVTFRNWKRAQARVGGRYRVGGMLIDSWTAIAAELRAPCAVAVGTIVVVQSRRADAAHLRVAS